MKPVVATFSIIQTYPYKAIVLLIMSALFFHF
jgi:hypothetical protein